MVNKPILFDWTSILMFELLFNVSQELFAKYLESV